MATWKGRRQRLINLFYFSFLEERHVVAPGRGIMRKYDNPGSLPVNTMNWHKVFESEFLFQADKECLVEKSAGRNNRQKVRFVHDQDVARPGKECFLQKESEVLPLVPIVKNTGPFTIWTVGV